MLVGKVFCDKDTTRIWNVWKLEQTGNLSYLIKDADYNEPIKLKKRDIKYINACYAKLMDSFDYSKFNLMKLYIEVLRTAIMYRGGEKKAEQKYNIAFKAYKDELNKTVSNIEMFDNEFETINDAYKYFSDTYTHIDVMKYRYLQFDYSTIKSNNVKEWDLFEDVVSLNHATGLNLDALKCTISEYDAATKLYSKIAQSQQKAS